MPSSGKRIKKQHPLFWVVEQSQDIERDIFLSLESFLKTSSADVLSENLISLNVKLKMWH